MGVGKFCKPVKYTSYIANKYCMESFCSIKDHLQDGFCDAGHDRPFCHCNIMNRVFALIHVQLFFWTVIDFCKRYKQHKSCSFLEELERTAALMAFEDVKNCPYGELLDLSR
ncbi:hypothetical protein KSP40_PGU013246 [Platanthera guangdongensis]|uniref:Uncharacterized protein n=1 Tax=Platanthera guangdongensis TaxID=2320717 RepID=A0ABR2M5U9_9ASPA